ncbi:WhiB family transcriptional regulator [Glycomyces salinus]|uniref:WhiB family transcriptional regulator n=1 Tax=Glycomyces salinus TaxID=980294 RepID=UPI0018EB6C7A|nr:WhiB family transcriptional regulator [Glycomyces salinus]
MGAAKAASISQDLPSLVAAVDALNLHQGRSLIGRFGRCATGDAPADRFYPEGRPLKAATELCGTCPVRRPCLLVALKTRERAGIWGGASYGTRKNLLRQIAAARKPTSPTPTA